MITHSFFMLASVVNWLFALITPICLILITYFLYKIYKKI